MAGRQDQRLDRLEHSLTPRQAVLLWMEEAHKLGSLRNYALTLKGTPDGEFPLVKLPQMVEKPIREAMKGQKREWVDRAVERAIKDVFFLFKLQFQANIDFIQEYQKATMVLAWLLEKLRRLRETAWLSYDTTNAWYEVCRQLPYPLNAETALAVKAATDNWVETWKLVDDGGIVADWVRAYFLSQGKTELPFSAIYLQPGDYPVPKYVSVPTKEEIGSLFPDEASFNEFLSGADFSNALSDIRDAQFDSLHDAARAEMEALVAKGRLKQGTVLFLETVPMDFLRQVPLVDGEWMDAYVIELAEWGAILMKRGYSFKSVDDNSPYAVDRIGKVVDGNFVDADAGVLESTRKAARASLARYPGRRKEFEGRRYISFSDYSAWKRRSVKGKLEANLSHGLLARSWNRWVEEGGVLAGVKAGLIECFTQDYAFAVFPDVQVEKRIKDRNRLLAGLRAHSLHDMENNEDGHFMRLHSYEKKTYRARVREWKELARAFLEEIYVLQLLTDTLSQRYFEGHSVLFPDVQERLDALIQGWEDLVDWYNDSIASEIEEHVRSLDTPSPFWLDAGLVKEQAQDKLPERMTYLVDQARAETLRSLGDHDLASDIMEKHLTDDEDGWIKVRAE